MKFFKWSAVVVVLLAASVANAGECILADANRDTGWSVIYYDSQVSGCQFIGNPGTGRNKGTLTLKLLVNNADPIQLEFRQRDKAPVNSFGLRMTMNLTVVNQFKALKELRGRTSELGGELRDNEFEIEDVHPGKAHFHQDPSFSPGPFRASTTCDCEGDKQFRLEGSFGASSMGTISGIGMHQIEQSGIRRNFSLTIEPRF